MRTERAHLQDSNTLLHLYSWNQKHEVFISSVSITTLAPKANVHITWDAGSLVGSSLCNNERRKNRSLISRTNVEKVTLIRCREERSVSNNEIAFHLNTQILFSHFGVQDCGLQLLLICKCLTHIDPQKKLLSRGKSFSFTSKPNQNEHL